MLFSDFLLPSTSVLAHGGRGHLDQLTCGPLATVPGLPVLLAGLAVFVDVRPEAREQRGDVVQCVLFDHVLDGPAEGVLNGQIGAPGQQGPHTVSVVAAHRTRVLVAAFDLYAHCGEKRNCGHIIMASEIFSRVAALFRPLHSPVDTVTVVRLVALCIDCLRSIYIYAPQAESIQLLYCIGSACGARVSRSGSFRRQLCIGGEPVTRAELDPNFTRESELAGKFRAEHASRFAFAKYTSYAKIERTGRFLDHWRLCSHWVQCNLILL